MMDKNKLIDNLAALEHDQWMKWAIDISEKETISAERLERWKALFVPYDQLPEEQKERDRVWARKVIDIMNDADVQHIRTKLVGVTFEGRQDNIPKVKPGQRLAYIHEADNQYDPNAIHVYENIERRTSLGHLSRTVAADVVRARNRGMRVRIECVGITGGEGPKSYGLNVVVVLEKK